MERWLGRVALVTGASVGIGAATAKKLVQHGMKVVGCARNVGPIQVRQFYGLIVCSCPRHSTPANIQYTIYIHVFIILYLPTLCTDTSSCIILSATLTCLHIVTCICDPHIHVSITTPYTLYSYAYT